MNKSSPFSLAFASILAFLFWLVFILLFALFWSNAYNLFQDIVIIIASLGIVIARASYVQFENTKVQ